MLNLRLPKILLLYNLLLLSTPCFTYEKNAPLHIQSDMASYHQATQHAIHQGNVILKQGPHELHADTLTIKQEKSGRFSLITAQGSPATFKAIYKDLNPVVASAKTIYYYLDKQLLVLEKDACVTHLQDKFEGPSLSYQIDKQIISATKQSNQRPSITIYPRS